MVSTRSMNKMISEEIIKELKKLIEPLATNKNLEILETTVNKFREEIIHTFDLKLKEKQEKIDYLNSQFEAQKIVIEHLEVKIDSNQQYARRSSLRVHGVECQENETPKDLTKEVKKCYSKLGVPFQSHEIDRMHRIGKKYSKDGKNYQSIIIKFTSWEARKKLYLARPKLFVRGVKKKPAQDIAFTISVDLTQRKYQLLKEAKGAVENNNNVDFIFADINFNLNIKAKDNSLRYFNSLSEFNSI